MRSYGASLLETALGAAAAVLAAACLLIVLFLVIRFLAGGA